MLEYTFATLRIDRRRKGGPWALQHGFTHTVRLAEKDAVTILEHLGITPYDEEYSDGHEEMFTISMEMVGEV